MRMRLLITFIYPLYIIHILYILYLINSQKQRCFGLGIGYVYIDLVSCVVFSYNTWAKRQK
jgi:hypothetical protein